MKKGSFLFGLGIGVIISVFLSRAQEFVLHKRDKKISVSCQQCVERLGEYEHIFSDVIKELARAFCLVADINGHVLGHIDKYVDGEQGGVHQLNKVQRAEFYKKISDICSDSSVMCDTLKQMVKNFEKQLEVVSSL